jgi:uncharacterized protein
MYERNRSGGRLREVACQRVVTWSRSFDAATASRGAVGRDVTRRRSRRHLTGFLPQFTIWRVCRKSCSAMALSWISGRSTTSFHHAKSPLQLRTKSGSDVTISDFCKSAVPPCQLNPLLFNGHLQTFWTAGRLADVPVYYKRKIFEADDPRFAGSFVVDFATEPFDQKDDSLPPRTAYFSEDELNNLGSLDSKPMLVALHGLSGGSHELYLRHVLAPLITKDAGWEACVVTARGCAQSKITTGILYNARATWDVRQVVKWLRKNYPNRPLFGIGFSLGANILSNVHLSRTISSRFLANIT